MFKVLAVVLLLLPLSVVSSQKANQDPRPEPSSPSGVSIVDFSYEDKLVDQEYWEAAPAPTPAKSPTPTVRRQSEPQTDRQVREADLRDRMSDLRRLNTIKPSSSYRWRFPGYEFQAQIKNETSKPVQRLVWLYQPADRARSQKRFLCNATLDPGAERKFKVLTTVPRSRVVDAGAPDTDSTPLHPSLPDMSIEYVEFADGSIWQAPDWRSTILLTRSGVRKLKKGKCTGL